ncbi:hypothetical protein SCLCIDRAFT_1183175 [Scleroderma citrinum Foug A]|uniref:Uncharacterized protein n=1 Tax=Scleroderma citrinum Foug A TaxID=1036808 RepID=A0A0C3DWQ8_9AGAM|nr:hypothetical protein SCLCIDRAFT_1183175 [Scleroderma citrinum Foug A]
MHAAGVIKPVQDSHDATFVWYETLVDKYARQKKRQPEYEMKTFYGQLQHIFVVSLPPDASLHISEPTSISSLQSRPARWSIPMQPSISITT